MSGQTNGVLTVTVKGYTKEEGLTGRTDRGKIVFLPEDRFCIPRAGTDGITYAKSVLKGYTFPTDILLVVEPEPYQPADTRLRAKRFAYLADYENALKGLNGRQGKV